MRALQVLAVGALLAAGLVARASIPRADPPVAITDSSLRSIACPAAEPCIGVGLTGSKYTVRVPMTARSAAGSWSVEALPGTSPAGDSMLAAVSCPSTTRCVAVGRQEVPAAYLGARSAGDRPVTELWDGSTWARTRGVVPPAAADAELRGVDCIRTTCMAVGSYARRLGDDRPLAEAWDGTGWTLRLPPRVRTGHEASEAVLSDVACVAPTSCVAVGRFSYDLTLFTGIAPLIQRWDGSTWRTERSANTRSLDTELNAVSCSFAGRCIAVGLQRRAAGIYAPFSEIWDGERWNTIRIAGPTGSPDAELLDVACPGPDRCVAVGFWATGARFRPLVETWDGERWTIDPLESPSDFSSSTLNSVDCSSRTICHAVGTYTRDTPLLHAFSVSISGERSTVLLVPDA
jgi:hypothetical protein